MFIKAIQAFWSIPLNELYRVDLNQNRKLKELLPTKMCHEWHFSVDSERGVLGLRAREYWFRETDLIQYTSLSLSKLDHLRSFLEVTELLYVPLYTVNRESL